MEQLTEIQWKTEYKTGIHVIDTQHERLFELYNEMVKQSHTHGILRINATIDELIKYAQHHFHYEESLMEKYQYANSADHMEEHSSFIDKVMELAVANTDGHSREHLIEFAEFLQDWLINHIMTVDRGYIDTIPTVA